MGASLDGNFVSGLVKLMGQLLGKRHTVNGDELKILDGRSVDTKTAKKVERVSMGDSCIETI